ncbi:MAG: hypothetical protein HUU22_16810 [Phycisphaerae bacterium]|nr:hypothetical protein [Phycisphaerae bacterium]NUQ47682.1 hypothetical protein [Phycisphaerae bacterium]
MLLLLCRIALPMELTTDTNGCNAHVTRQGVDAIGANVGEIAANSTHVQPCSVGTSSTRIARRLASEQRWPLPHGRGWVQSFQTDDQPGARPGVTASQPAGADSQPAGTDSQPASAPDDAAPSSSGDERIDSILDRLETKGKAVRDLRTEVRREAIENFPVEGEKRTQDGKLLFRRLEPNPRFVIRFEKFTADGIVRDDLQAFWFDGEWLIELQEKTKRAIRRQVVRPGEKVDVFKIGHGPFPLPFGQSRRDMLRNFSIRLAPPKPHDPPNCDHLVCIPRASGDLERRYKQVDLYVDRKLELPVRIDAVKKQDDAEIRVYFNKIEVNVGLAAAEFEFTLPAGYHVSEEPLSEE